MNNSVCAVYEELRQAVASIDEQEDLRWWRNTHGPGMPTDWPHFQVTVNHSRGGGDGVWWAGLNSSVLHLFSCEGVDATTEEEQEGEEGGAGEDGDDREEVGGASGHRKNLIVFLFQLTFWLLPPV